MKKALRIAVILGILLSFSIFNAPLPASADQPLKVDKFNPVFAKDVELAKKAMIVGEKGPAKAPKRTFTASTGVLGAPVTGNKYAIVIGISNYPDTANDLQYSDDDAVDMASALTGTYGFKPGDVTSLVDLNATREHIVSAIANLGQIVKPGDEVVFFYSGHGGRGRANDGDSEITDECIWAHDGTQLVPIWDGELAALFSAYQTNRIVFIFDSCYAGGMTDLKAPGRIIAMGSGENSLSYELSSLANGEFTYYMVDRGMLAYLADTTDSPLPSGHDVTIEEAWDYANANVRYDAITINDSFTDDMFIK
jgi:metacaspase-1